MGQHKHNPIAIVAKSGGLPPKKKHTFKLYKAIWRAICYGVVMQKAVHPLDAPAGAVEGGT